MRDKGWAILCANCGHKISDAASGSDRIGERKMSIPHKCPVCDGQGIVSRPPYLAGDVETWEDSQTSYPCRACNGTGIVWGEK